MARLAGRTAIVTGGAKGIVCHYVEALAAEGAEVVIADVVSGSALAAKIAAKYGGNATLGVICDVSNEMQVKDLVATTIERFGKIDILVNNAAEQHPQESIEKITEKQLERTFRTNIFSFFFMTKAAMKYLNKGGAIINTTSVTAYKGSAHLLDYSSTKGAITAFTRSLSQALADKRIRVNGVAPGPIWTPLIPSTFSPEEVE